jgi:hypothetical protein
MLDFWCTLKVVFIEYGSHVVKKKDHMYHIFFLGKWYYSVH